MKKFNFKDTFNMNKNKTIKIGILVFVCVIAAISVFTISRGLLLADEEEIELKSIEIKSDGWETQEPGAWKITKSAEWTGFNEARITMDLETVPKYIDETKNYDIILNVGLSPSMTGDKFDSLKESLYKYTNEVLSNPQNQNRIALMGHQGNATIVSNFTNDINDLSEKINNMVLTCYRDNHCSDYYLALNAIDALLNDYEENENRQLIVIFLVDRNPEKNFGLIQNEYNKLKNKYSNIVINGIQYEMGTTLNHYLEISSDYQYDAYTHDLFDKLLVSTYKDVLEKYEKLEITDYMSEDFYVNDSNDINANYGEAELDEVGQTITWNLGSDFNIGNRARITIDVKIKNEDRKENIFLETSTKTSIKYKLLNEEENVLNSDRTPKLQSYYTLIYDYNAPPGCELRENKIETHFVYESVIKTDEEPYCTDYVLRGWQIVEDETFSDVTKLSSESFLMPERDLIIRAEWGSLDISKSVNGELASIPLLYELVGSDSVPDNIASKFVTAVDGIDFTKYSSENNGRGTYLYSETKDDEYPIYYYRGNVINNNILFANYCWKIVRTTETGGTKLIYNGVPDKTNTGGVCNNMGATTVIGSSTWHTVGNLILHSSYMPLGSSSVVKTHVDNWYSNNIKNVFSRYLEDTVWCIDSVDPYTITKSDGITYSYYNGSFLRISMTQNPFYGDKPIVICPKQEDSFTIKDGNYPTGNNLLDYPIALLTTDEFILAGFAEYTENNSTYTTDPYLYNNYPVWTLSYGYYYWGAASKHVVREYGIFGADKVIDFNNGIRPAISLKHDVKVISGDGTVNYPYIIQ